MSQKKTRPESEMHHVTDLDGAAQRSIPAAPTCSTFAPPSCSSSVRLSAPERERVCLCPRLRHGLLTLYGRPPGRFLARHASSVTLALVCVCAHAVRFVPE